MPLNPTCTIILCEEYWLTASKNYYLSVLLNRCLIAIYFFLMLKEPMKILEF